MIHSLPQVSSMPLPECYRDGTFDLVVRDAESVAVFWDLARASEPPHAGSRLCLQITNAAGSTDTLILHHDAGHVLVPLNANGSRDFEFALGWSDAEGFNEISRDSVELPPSLDRRKQEETATSMSCHRGSVFLPLAAPVERRGFRPRPEV